MLWLEFLVSLRVFRYGCILKLLRRFYFRFIVVEVLGGMFCIFKNNIISDYYVVDLRNCVWEFLIRLCGMWGVFYDLKSYMGREEVEVLEFWNFLWSLEW